MDLSLNLKPGETIYANLIHVSSSGMMRVFRFYIMRDNRPIDITRDVAEATGMKWDSDRWGLKVSGAGMDMAFHVVYSLGRALYPDGVPCTGSSGYKEDGTRTKAHRCLSNDHVNPGDREYRRGRKHSDGGYAFNKEML